MVDQYDEPESSDGQILEARLLKLRMRDGLVAARLRGAGRELAAPLLRLPAVQGDAEAAVNLVGDCVRRMTIGTHQIVADATLALGLFADSYAANGVPQKVIEDLRSDALGRRRLALLNHWHRLHESLSFTSGPPPSDRTLRETVEARVLRELAYALVSPLPPTVLLPADEPVTPQIQHTSGRVIVVGGAVMDAIFRTKMIPAHETSGIAHDFTLTPGGKGLWQAVAAAKLGLDVSLIAAIGDDRFGRDILAYLRAENVDTSLMKVVRGARTPFTGVVELDLGDSIALIWRNDQVVKLEVGDIEAKADQLTGCDALLLTFEVPRETTQRTLALAHTDPDTRPLVIVTSGQPYPDEGISRASLQLIDYLVSHAWELEKYSPPDLQRFNPDRVGEHLLSRGVETLCLLGNGGGTIYSDTDAGTFRLSSVSSLYREVSTVRDAFCAALAARLLENNRTFTREVAHWATAAMASTAESFGQPDSLPDRDRIEKRLKTLM